MPLGSLTEKYVTFAARTSGRLVVPYSSCSSE